MLSTGRGLPSLSCAGIHLRLTRNSRSSNLVPIPKPAALRICILRSRAQLLPRSICCLSQRPPTHFLGSKGNHILDVMEMSDSERKLYTRMRLWEFPDQFIIEPTDGMSDSYLAISRVDGSMNLIGELPQSSTFAAPKVQSVFGVIGMMKLLVGSYLLVITGCECVGSYLGHAIYKVSSLQILPCNQSLSSSSAKQKKMESEFSVLLNAAERTSGLYFSYDVNLTLSAQRLHALSDESKLLPLWRQADPRFLWNSYTLEALIDNKLDPYLLPVIQGSYQNFQATIGNDNANVTLIARRCTRRTGTRMWRRGADSEGFVANFVETEQILQSNGFTASFVQVIICPSVNFIPGYHGLVVNCHVFDLLTYSLLS